MSIYLLEFVFQLIIMLLIIWILRPLAQWYFGVSILKKELAELKNVVVNGIDNNQRK